MSPFPANISWGDGVGGQGTIVRNPDGTFPQCFRRKGDINVPGYLFIPGTSGFAGRLSKKIQRLAHV
jgi:hypothetical protein